MPRPRTVKYRCTRKRHAPNCTAQHPLCQRRGCHGDTHIPDCRPGRPLCWTMRQVQKAKYGVCCCGVVHYPHRAGWCASGVPLRQQNALTYGPEDPAERAEIIARRERADAALARARKAG